MYDHAREQGQKQTPDRESSRQTQVAAELKTALSGGDVQKMEHALNDFAAGYLTSKDPDKWLDTFKSFQKDAADKGINITLGDDSANFNSDRLMITMWDF